MDREEKKNCKTVDVKEFVTVAFAEDMDLAKQYQNMLEQNEINVRIKRQAEMAQSGLSDIAIMVPEESLDEAHALISEKLNYDDFFDMAFDDQDGDQFDFSNFEAGENDDLY